MKKIKYLLICLSTISLLGCNETITLSKVNNITYSDGLLSFDAVEKAEGYNVKFSHLNEVVYEDKIKDTAIDVESLGLEGNINLEISAYYQDTTSEVTNYNFTVLSKFEDVIFEAEDNLYNFGTGKEQSNFRNNPSASKGAYVGGIDDAGQGVYINYLCPSEGTFTLEAYYLTEAVPAHNDVWVNGVYQARYDFIENTGYGGDKFTPAKAEVSISLIKGWNTISIFKNGDNSDNYGSFAELDYFVLKGNGATYNVDDLLTFGEKPSYYRLEAEMGSPRKKDPNSLITSCKNPCIVQNENNKYSNGFLMGGVELQYDGVSWHFNSPVKAKYSVKIAYASGEFNGSKKAKPSFIVTQEEVQLAKNADFKKYNCVTMNELPYTGWNNVQVSEESVEITLEQGKNFINCLLLEDLNNVNSGFFQIDYVDMKFLSEIE